MTPSPELPRVLSDEQIGAICDEVGAWSTVKTIPFARAIESAVASALQAQPAVPARSTGYVAPKGRYVPPVLFNPYSGEPRDARDIHTDPQGFLIVPPGADLLAATPTAPAASPAKYTLDDFFAEAQAKNLTADDLRPGLVARLAEMGDPD